MDLKIKKMGPSARPPARSSKRRWYHIVGSPMFIKVLSFLAFVTILSPFILPWLGIARSSLPPPLRPFAGPKLASLPQFAGSYASRMLWGTYRPGYYFGLRPRAPRSLLFGLMWLDPQRRDALQNIRHEAQMRDGLKQYGWLAHDGESFGRQGILDEQFNLTTSWIKHPTRDGTWSARVSAQLLRTGTDKEAAKHDDDQYDDDSDDNSGQEQEPISLFFYIATEDLSPVEIHGYDVAEAFEESHGSIVRAMDGKTAPFGPWTLSIHAHPQPNAQFYPAASFYGLRTKHLHNLTDTVRYALHSSLYDQRMAGKTRLELMLPNYLYKRSNVGIMQITAAMPCTFDLVFSSGSGMESHALHLVAESVGEQLTGSLQEAENEFDNRFSATFGKLLDAKLPRGTIEAARAALSNLLGGMGYWHGHSLVKLPESMNPQNSIGPRQDSDPYHKDYVTKLWNTALFSATPSRSFFPRGFLWDEGFHQLLVRRWKPSISRDALAHWLDLMTASGWIPREQILGAEARSRVPEEFIAQSPDAANPPALFLPLADMARNAAQHGHDNAEAAADLEFLRAAWPRLRTWYLWYNTTQAGPLPGSYRWRGRDPNSIRELNPKTLTSGLDDYPRASHPSEEERHLDLRCWMALAAQALGSVGTAAGAPAEEVAAFAQDAARLNDYADLKALHWDSTHGRFADWGMHTEGVALVDPSTDNNNNNNNNGGEWRRMLVEQDKYGPPKPQFVPHYGYLSLFPLIMGMIPKDSPDLGQQLKALKQPDELWSDYGLRSLSKSSTLYYKHNTQHDPPYWRGPIWINVNVLVLRALRRYGAEGGPYAQQAQQAAEELRTALLNTVVEQYNSRGYLFESYSDIDGQGKGCHPFTGWTALLALVAAEG